MKRIRLFAVLLLACSSSDPPRESAPTHERAPAPPTGPIAAPCVMSPAMPPTDGCTQHSDALDEALAKIGKDRCGLRLSLDDASFGMMKPRDRRALPDFGKLLERPLQLGSWGMNTANALLEASARKMPVSESIARAAVRLGTTIDTCPEPSLFVVDPQDASPLATAIADATGDDLPPDVVTGVDLELQRALAPIVRTIGWASTEAKASWRKLRPADFMNAVDFAMGTGRLFLDDERLKLIDQFDSARMVRAALTLAIAIESADLGRFRGIEVPALDITTRIGNIVLRGPGNDTYGRTSKAANAALVFDSGGDDTYFAPAGAATLVFPASVLIDLGGRDRYAHETKAHEEDAKAKQRTPSDHYGRGVNGLTLSRVARQGAGVFGIGMLFDLGGDGDTYRSLVASQGAAVFGVGVLFDEGGDDTYEAEALSQGAAAWGLGLLLDQGGNDRHFAYSAAQGYGFVRGIGALVDVSGDDVYETDSGDPALGGDPIYPNAQLPGKANTSMAQGAGRGVRPDSPEPGYPLPGGLGILLDGRGNDRYSTGVFGQGSSFAMGTGMLVDREGNDTYEGLWYVQGASAHTGLALFVDQAGDDRYNPTFPIAATSLGVGHDLSVAIHADLGGSDTYRAPGLSLGTGNTNGIGIFLNNGGDDVFEGHPPLTLGAASATEIAGDPKRKTIPTVGVFVKAGGSAKYTGSASAAAGATWSSTANPQSTVNEIAVGIDRPNGQVVIP